MFPPIIPSGTKLGVLRSDVARGAGLGPVEVLATCSHDTGAAVAAVPAQRPGIWAYISSGTWSLMGVEVAEPVINDACRELNFTNEIGYGGSVRLLKNIVGLWIVQECRRHWAKHGEIFDYDALTQLAATAPPFAFLLDPTDPRFLAPNEMPAKIAAFCRETGQPPPSGPGVMIRGVIESLALLYRRTLWQLQQLTGKSVERVHIVGGGSQNALLNQCTADALQLPVLAGPVEATAAGNILVQAMTLGHIPSLGAGRALICESFPLQEFQPRDEREWSSAYVRFENLLGSRSSVAKP
jgi:rhamnulokinase